ncbi:hypothetical protein ACFPN2_01085 [Steroidobacter flavus]|uniref:EthD domain-containing protein n=1 Tax=Steroidobacter flavus TaxID=1842136 RepID=A0ABV8SMQ2_9GAMM
MTDADRRYLFIAKTFDAPGLSPTQFTKLLSQTALPVWRQLYRDCLLASVQTLRKVGDVDLQTSSQTVRDWEYFILLELSEHASSEEVLRAEIAHGLTVANLASQGIDYLSNELLQRPAQAGTAIPVPSPRYAEWPSNQHAAIEYIDIPAAHWLDYRQFMKEVMGPVGAQLVRQGDSYQVQILEGLEVVHRDASLPAWNRIHLLWGEFDDPINGFFKHTNAAIDTVLGAGRDVQTVLGQVASYRTKPRMSKNVAVPALSIPRSAQVR